MAAPRCFSALTTSDNGPTMPGISSKSVSKLGGSRSRGTILARHRLRNLHLSLVLQPSVLLPLLLQIDQPVLLFLLHPLHLLNPFLQLLRKRGESLLT